MEEHGRIFCGRCGHAVEGDGEGRFLGFERYTCETCEAAVTGPLARGPHTAARIGAIAALAAADLLLLFRFEVLGFAALAAALVALGLLSANQRIGRNHRVRGRNVWLSQLARRADRLREPAHTTGG